MDKLGLFHVNQNSMCLDPHQNYWCDGCRESS